jgi:hypothetical protein
MNEYVSPIMLDKLCNANSCMELSSDKVKKIIRLQIGDIVITGTKSSGALGWISCWGYCAVLHCNYNGKISPLFEKEHSISIYQGIRERGYDGRLFKHEGIKYVLQGPQITFLPLNILKAQQLTLF